MPRAVSTLHAVCQRHAIILNPYRMADLYCRLIRPGNRFDCPGGTNFAAFGALRPAVSTLVRHRGLHERRQTCGRTKHAVGTCRHAKLASRTVLGKMSSRQRAGRRYRSKPVRRYLVLDGRQPAIHFFLLLRQGCACCSNSQPDKELAAASPINSPTGEALACLPLFVLTWEAM